jgi:iron complex outermembrane receptor protein
VLVGSELAFAPNFQGNIRASAMSGILKADCGLTAHVMPQLIISGDSVSDVIEINKIDLEGYTMASFSTGSRAIAGAWKPSSTNLTDEYGPS